MRGSGMYKPFTLGGSRRILGARKCSVVERIHDVVVYDTAEACDLVGVQAGAGPADRAAHSSTCHAEIVGSLGGTGSAGNTLRKTGPFL